MIESKTGWSADEILDAGRHPGRPRWAPTASGSSRATRNRSRSRPRPASAPSSRPGSATRSAPGSWRARVGLSGHERAAQVGCTLAAYVVETVGTQEYSFTTEQFVERLRSAYGDDAAAEVARPPRRLSAGSRSAGRGGPRSGGTPSPAPSPRRRTRAPSSGTTRRRRRAAAVVGDDAEELARLDVADVPGQRDDRERGRPVRGSRARASAGSGPGSRSIAPGELGEEPLDVVLRRVRGRPRRGRCRGSAHPSRRARGSARGSRRCRPIRSRPRIRAGPARSPGPRRRRRGRRR